MKTMTCKQLGGACNQEFHADTFDQMAKQSQAHGVEMYEKGDKPHMEAMKQMQELASSPESMDKWMAEKRKEFDALPEE